jgi:hypothetical protein
MRHLLPLPEPARTRIRLTAPRRIRKRGPPLAGWGDTTQPRRKKKLAEFNDYLRENRRVYEMFEQAALDRLAAGESRVGAKEIFEDMRKLVGNTGGAYDLDNTWAPWFARKAILAHPQLNTVIETRASLADILLNTAQAKA